MNASHIMDEHECRAAAINAVFLRCDQLGRNFFTAEDARASDLIVRALMQLQTISVEQNANIIAPQTLPQHTEVSVYAAVEKALTLEKP